MNITSKDIRSVSTDPQIYNRLLSLDRKHILELGCGKAEKTREIATGGRQRKVFALEVDKIQHEKNLAITDLPNVTFMLAEGQSLPFADDFFDIAFMFKSLHHIPEEKMVSALHEVRRVLKHKGYLYISEPVFSGPFNEIMSIFHNEEGPRKKAFEAIKSMVDEKHFYLERELFYHFSLKLKDFEEFEQQFIRTTHTLHDLSPEIYERVKERFNATFKENNGHFLSPMRVDLLQKIVL